VTVSEWKELRKGETLQGVFTLSLPSGMIIHGCMLHVKDGRRWVALPSKEYQVSGQKKYSRIIEFDSKETHERFQAAALAAVDRQLEVAHA
jgi:hypothetical protein